MSKDNSQSDIVLFVEDFVTNRIQDIYLHNPPVGDPTILRDVRRRGNSAVKQPHYYNKNHTREQRKREDPTLQQLPLHHLNAKQMKMSSMWGWYLPEKHNQRSETSFLKLLKTHAVFHDSSYFEKMLIKGDLKNIQSLIQILSNNQSTLSPQCQSGEEIQTIPIYFDSSNDTIFVGPCQILYEPSSSTILLSCHPSISHSIFSYISTLSTLNLQTISLSCCHFSIRGKNSIQLLHSLFPSLSSNELSHHHIYPYQYQSSPSIGNYYAPEYSSTSEIGHQQQALPKQVYYFKQESSKEMEIEEESSSFDSLLNSSSSYCMIIPYLTSSLHQASTGFDIIMTSHVATLIWSFLIQHHCIPLAQTEWHSFHTFVGVSLFPYDYPETPAGLTITLTSYSSPFNRDSVPAQLSLPIHSLLSLYSSIQPSSPLLTIRRGEAVAQLLRRKELEGNHVFIPVHVKVLGKGNISLPCAIKEARDEEIQARHDHLFIPPTQNETIGFVTSFVYSQKASAYVGIGVCSLEMLWNLFNKQKSRSNCIVLLANSRSPSACFARLTVCLCNE